MVSGLDLKHSGTDVFCNYLQPVRMAGFIRILEIKNTQNKNPISNTGNRVLLSINMLSLLINGCISRVNQN